jgi:hypothetical protein
MSYEFHQINDLADYQPDGRELEPIEDESDGERDLRCSGSFSEAQGRLARALDFLTSEVAPHLEEKP